MSEIIISRACLISAGRASARSLAGYAFDCERLTGLEVSYITAYLKISYQQHITETHTRGNRSVTPGVTTEDTLTFERYAEGDKRSLE